MELRTFTDEQINAALSRSQETKLTTINATAELAVYGLPLTVLAYAQELAKTNIARWGVRGVDLTAVDGFAVGWVDGVTVGLELAKER